MVESCVDGVWMWDMLFGIFIGYLVFNVENPCGLWELCKEKELKRPKHLGGVAGIGKEITRGICSVNFMKMISILI